MKPITNILLLLALVCYVFLSLFEISLVGNLTGLQFTASMITANQGASYTAFALIPFVTMFLAIAFNCLKNRYWGIVVAVLIFFALYFFANVATMFQGFSLEHDPSVAADLEMTEGLPVAGLGIGFYSSLALTILALISALVSLMPFKFNKRLEESIDKRFMESKKHISKVGHDIHGEFHKHGKHTKHEKEEVKNETTAASEAVIEQKPDNEAPAQEDDSRFMPKQEHDDEQYSDYMPK